MEMMKSLWFLVYPMLCAFVPCIVYQIIIIKKGDAGKKIRVKHLVWSYIFILYLFMALYMTGIGTVWDIGKYDTIILWEKINMIPFQSGGVVDNILNIIMFMPFGFLLPLIWIKYRHFVRTILTAFGFTLAIEAAQLFNNRATDIDDLIMNTLGAAVGYGIWFVFSGIFKCRKKEDDSIAAHEGAAYLILAVLGTFFIYNPRYFVSLFYF